jgi:hypothetical protein
MDSIKQSFAAAIAQHIPPDAWNVICEKHDARPSEALWTVAMVLASWPGLTISHSDTAAPADRIILPIAKAEGR